MKCTARSMLAVVLTTAACSSAGLPASTSDFPAAPLFALTSDLGQLRVEVRTSPQPPVRGNDNVELTITSSADATPRDDLNVDVSPFMPSMNHGSSAIPTVIPKGGGKYLVTNVDLFMPGHWELRTTFLGPPPCAGCMATSDHATPAVDIP